MTLTSANETFPFPLGLLKGQPIVRMLKRNSSFI